MAYGENTKVSQMGSISEIERTLMRYGASGFMYGWQHDAAAVCFTMANRQIRIAVPLPNKDDPQFRQTETGRARVESAAIKEWEQACRQRYRSLSLIIKAKLEAIEVGIRTFDEEFMADIVLTGGRTIGQQLLPGIDHAISSGSLPPLLPNLD
ncbi:hypothetical protein [Shewanella fodinae]|uniref:hypothetical protein n=1 Tax=Shewanella fodinae TaxID=552357 RepID=UPI00167B8C21|nr:hypothetical protein [Shewanella fodinae]MCL2905173.1 hypothetical protein [Shewanella fodinae]GGY88015.1 hypothetical protein GCM10007169_01510 [Shewanella fodinae]